MSSSEDDFEDETPRARRGASARTAKAAGGVDPKMLFLYATPFTLAVLLGMGYYLYSLPDPRPPTGPIVLDYTKDIDLARAKFQQAKPLYTAGKNMDGEAGLPKLREAQTLLRDANEIIDKVRVAIDALPPEPTKPGDPEKYHPHDELEQQITMLLVSCRKEIGARVPDPGAPGSEKDPSAQSPPPGGR